LGKRVAQPLEDQIGIHSVALRHLRQGNVRNRRLETERRLLFVRPRLLRPTRHACPSSEFSGKLGPFRNGGSGSFSVQVFQQNPVLHRLVPTLDLALGLRVMRA
jgi:hypothetical protein